MSNDNKKQTESQAWYKHPWVWFMIALPASAVVASLYTVYVASQHAPVVIAKQNKFQMEKQDSDQ